MNHFQGHLLVLCAFNLTNLALAGDSQIQLPPTVIENTSVFGIFDQYTDVGQPGDADGGLAVFSVREEFQTRLLVHEKQGQDWVLVQSLDHPKTLAKVVVSGDTFCAMSIDDEAPIRVYRRIQGLFEVEQSIEKEDIGFWFFNDIHLEGDTLVLSGDGPLFNHIQVFERSGNTWNFLQKLDVLSNNSAVAISGNSILTGSDELHFFERVDGNWQMLSHFPNTPAEDVILDGDTGLVRGPQGTPLVFRRVAESWQNTQTLPTFISAAPQGQSMDILGDLIVHVTDPVSGPSLLQIYERGPTQWDFAQQVALPMSSTTQNHVCFIANTQEVLASFGDNAIASTLQQGFSWNVGPTVDLGTTDPGGRFGYSSDLDGSRMIVGAPDGTPDPFGQGDPATGLATIYNFDGTNWNVEAILSPPGEAADNAADEFGYAVAIDGDRALVGSPNHGSGEAYVYAWIDGNWQLEATLRSFDVSGSKFGRAVDMDGQRAAIGAPGLSGAGAAFTYRFNAGLGVWEERDALLAPNSSQGDRFGFAVSVDRSHMAVSARASSVVTYLDTPSGWLFEQALPVPTPFDNGPNGWGWSLDIDDTHMVVGAPYTDPGMLSGQVYVYERMTDGAWILEDQFFTDAEDSQEHLGFDVDIEGDLIAASFDSDFTGQGGNKAGFWLYQRSGSGWAAQAKVSETWSGFAGQVALSQEKIMVVSDTRPPGEVVVYDIDHQPASFCWGNGSGVACPCDNLGAEGAGCANSETTGAVLSNTGSTSIANADLLLTASQLPLNKAGLVFAGTLPIGATLGDGLLCLIPQYRGQIMFSGISGSFDQPDLEALLNANPGDTWYAQVWYRDPAGRCGLGFNTSNGLVLSFTP